MTNAVHAASTVWDAAADHLDGLPGGGLNIAHEALDRHVSAGAGGRVALRWLSRHDGTQDLTYRDMSLLTNRFANAMSALGHDGSHGVATLLGRVPELYVAALGTFKGRGVYTPLFSAFGPDPIAMRMNLGRISVLVTTARFYRRKVAGIRSELPELQHVLIVGGGADDIDDPSVLDMAELLAAASDEYRIPATDPQDPALLHFTSGTTGTPKGALHVHQAVVAHAATGRLVLELDADVRYWCTADPGWVTGTSYGIVSPLVNGATCIVDEGEFDADRWCSTIADERVNVFYTAPTALRMLRRSGDERLVSSGFPALSLVASVGEPLDPESAQWASEAFGVPVLDNWWQTETGAMMISNQRGREVKPGSMGLPLPGIVASLLRCDADGELELDDDGQPIEITTPTGDELSEAGEIVLERGWPSMFRGYLDQDERYQRCFVGSWYRSGDLAKRDRDGYFWFVGRNNDVIKSAGHLIGPFEVESALAEHPGVVESAVIGKPDPTIGELVKAFVVLADGVAPSAETRRELTAHTRRRLGPAVAPREIDFATELPHTRSGKIMRRLLRARELGLPEGDTSTLEAL